MLDEHLHHTVSVPPSSVWTARLPGAPHGPGRPLTVADFTEEVFAHLPRADQRRWAEVYLAGLLTTRGKKSIRNLALTVPRSATAAQSLQQFINSSPWPWDPARRAIAAQVVARMPVAAWATGIAVIPKRGEHSVGVHRRFVPEAGRTVNCQLGIGLFLSSGDTSVPVDWRLLLDERWCGDERLRSRARLPLSAAAEPVSRHVLGMVDALAGTGLTPPVPVVADLRCTPEAGPLVAGLAERGLDFVVELHPSQPVLPAVPAPSRGTEQPRPLPAGEYAGRGERARQPRVISAARADGPVRHLVVHSGLVRLPVPPQPGRTAPQPVYRLLTQWSAAERRPIRFWLTAPTDRRADEVLSLVRHSVRTQASLKSLERDFGLLDFEGRSFPGWHHHMTMVTAAYALHRLGGVPADIVEPADIAEPAAADGRRLA
ncbi:IS701 family transposase [Streptomyces sp. SCPE 10]|uniref:IS701 family transposase n=1 Tax=Streptomyces sp. SCPE 10 TaxID=3449273 RepID=UPI003F7FDCF9